MHDDNNDNYDNKNWFEIDTLLPCPQHEVWSPYNDIMLVKLKLQQAWQTISKYNSNDDNKDDYNNNKTWWWNKSHHYEINCHPNSSP